MLPDSQGFVILQSVDSTNNYAMAQVHAGMAKHGQAFFAFHQTAGKGQRGKRWDTGTGENIALSLVLEPARFSSLSSFVLSALIATVCCDLVSKTTKTPASVKWPNDIYIGDRKAGGILIETLMKGTEWLYAVAGIGINVNRTGFPLELHNPTSLQIISGKSYDTLKLAQTLVAAILSKLENAQPGEILERYNHLLYKKGETVALKKDNMIFQAKILGVTEKGRLVVHHGFEQELEWGEVEWKLPGV